MAAIIVIVTASQIFLHSLIKDSLFSEAVEKNPALKKAIDALTPGRQKWPISVVFHNPANYGQESKE